ncbi:MAG: AMP-binding protein [Deltaproteobacteria bacterium]|nr:AMP-binding protein [Deltaproteobacteria bacterium]
MFLDERLETMEREGFRVYQLRRLRRMLKVVLAQNPFYRRKLEAHGLTPGKVTRLRDVEALPFTTKAEIAEDQLAHPPYGTNLTYPLERYVRFHQTSGSTGKPIRWLDTAECWEWWNRCWGFVYKGVGVGPGDRLYFAFSFGPFIGFWSSFDTAPLVGALAIPGGGQDSLQRLHALIENECTVLLCTPTYALRLAQVAREHGIDIAGSAIRTLILAGEPGASIPAVKRRIETAWGARCYDHSGMTEVGALSFECEAQSGGIHLIESEFIGEVLNPETGEPVKEGARGELVVTNLGRLGMPLIRYRTGDLVELTRERCPCGRSFARLMGGILGRTDDMIVVRGINVFPSAIESILREFPEIEEYRVEVRREREMDEIAIQIELRQGAAAGLSEQVTNAIKRGLNITPRIHLAAPGSLPRFELKARRFVYQGERRG